MPRTTINATPVKGPFVALQPTADSLDAVYTAADTVNFNQVVAAGTQVLVAVNIGASPYTVTITSAPGSNLRTGDITAYSIGAGEMMAFVISGQPGWVQADGFVYFQGSNASVKFAILQL